MQNQILHVVKRAWIISHPFWTGPDRGRACLLLGAIVALNLGLVAISVLLTFWQRSFFNSLEAKDWDAFIALLVTWHTPAGMGIMPGFAVILLVFVLLTVYADYLQQGLRIRWRSAMTADLIEQWVSGRAYYALSTVPNRSDNPDQRIAEDADLFVDGTLTLGMGLLTAVVSLLSFVILLWTLSDTIQVFGFQFSGSLVWIALFYAFFGTVITHLLGRRLISLNFEKQRAEANFRFGLIRLRENAESIAFYHGEDTESRALSQKFGVVVHNWHTIMSVTKRMMFFASGFTQAALVFPLAIVAPAYFAGRIALGGVFQSANAFVKVQEALSWVVGNYGKIAEWSATVQRLDGFILNVVAVAGRSSQRLSSNPELVTSDLILYLPNKQVLSADLALTIRPGDRVLIQGASGAGKSTLLRTFAGLWPHYSGQISLPNAPSMFIPQNAYVPTGTLVGALCYPSVPSKINLDEAKELLAKVGLAHLSDQLDKEDVWSAKLSGGELQRIALARVLVHRPSWIFLDEATAHLDAAAEKEFYTMLMQTVPDATLVSVGHRDQLQEFHDRVMLIEQPSAKG